MNTLLLIGTMLMLLLTGCDTKIEPDKPTDGKYATQNQTSSLEYSIYMNKQITVFTNQLSTRMGSAKNISNGYNVDNEITLAEQSLSVMQAAYDETNTVYPPNGADDDRQATLTAMETSISHMENYIEDLKSNNDVSGYFKDFENDFNQLAGLASLYYE